MKAQQCTIKKVVVMTTAIGLFGWFALWAGSALAAETLTLHQRAEIMAQQHRLVGNLRAQARREGVVVEVPQLYVYHSDASAAFHLDGYRSGFERELSLTVDRGRRARSMVRLDRLLERVTDTDGDTVTLADLPPTSLYVVLVRNDSCAACDQMEAALSTWLADRDEALWITILTDQPR